MHALCVGALVLGSTDAAADLAHDTVSGVAIERANVGGGHDVAWSKLSAPRTADRVYSVRFTVRDAEAVLVPHCNGRQRIAVDSVTKDRESKGPFLLRFDDPVGPHEITVDVEASAYEKRIACTEPPRAGAVVRSSDGLSLLRFPSPHAAKTGPEKRAAGEAVVFIPGGHDIKRPSALLVGTHPWNGGPWTYAAYHELIEEAGKKDVVLLMPSGLGNSLYTADAEDEVMRAIDALSAEVAIDSQRVSIWGASMGGAGASTISFHHPDRFAFVASYFGDSRYDLNSYVRGVLGGEEGARRVNPLDVLENARHLPVFLVHGEDDRTCPIRQSIMLFDAMKKAGFTVSFERAPAMGHEGPLVVKHIRHVVDRAATSTAPARPSRVSFRSMRASDTEAYGVRIVRSGAGAASSMPAFVDLERKVDGVHVLAAEGVKEIVLAKDALGAKGEEPVKIDAPDQVQLPPQAKVTVQWAP